MAMIRRLMPAQVTALNDDEVEVRASTVGRARDGHILIPQGAQLDAYRKCPVMLWNHDTELPPVGRAEEITIDGDEIVCRAKFPPAGISPRADEIRGLTKAGFINGVSVGFDIVDGEPIEVGKPTRGLRITNWELLEISFCCIPVDSEALVTARAEKAEDWKCGASRELPIEDSDSWDGPAAEASIFEWAGGDDFDPSKARKGFLAYNAAKPKERGSYKLPIAHVADGRLKVPKGAIRAAASGLPQTDIPDDVKDSAKAVIKHYEEKAGMGEKDDRAVVVKHKRALARASKPAFRRGLYEVSSLAYLVSQLGFAHDAAEWEAEVEEDDSKVPGMLGEALKQLGEALIAMTQEEVQELLADTGDDDEGVELAEEERAYVAGGKTARTRAWRRGIAMVRAGRTLSATNEKHLERALKHHSRAMKHHKDLGAHQEEAGQHLEAAQGAHEKAVKAHGELGEALQAVKNEPQKAEEHMARAMKAHRAVGSAHEDVAEAHQDLEEAHQNSEDSHNALGRCMGGVQRCVRAVVDGSTPGAEDGDSKDVQTSAGTDEDDEGSRSLEVRQRRAEALRLAVSP